MTAKEKVLAEVKRRGKLRSRDVVALLGVSRQTAANHLRTLVERGMLARSGSTRNAEYLLPPKAIPLPTADRSLDLIRKLKGLEEHRVYSDVALALNLNRDLRPKARAIAEYAFTEMLNNAIDHSKARDARIHVELSRRFFSFTIRDVGVGVFRTIRERFRLADSYEALTHLLKGKQTTAPEAHSGEGIFFTSRIADSFTLRSERLRLWVDNFRKDQFVNSEKSFLRGTEVSFKIRRQTRKDLAALFREYTSEDYAFDRTQVRVRLSERDGNYVSRSEAKRLLAGLDKFRQVSFDFTGVRGVGQGFTDEVFRVFANSHPKIKLEVINAKPEIEMMVRRARKGLTVEALNSPAFPKKKS